MLDTPTSWSFQYIKPDDRSTWEKTRIYLRNYSAVVMVEWQRKLRSTRLYVVRARFFFLLTSCPVLNAGRLDVIHRPEGIWCPRQGRYRSNQQWSQPAVSVEGVQVQPRRRGKWPWIFLSSSGWIRRKNSSKCQELQWTWLKKHSLGFIFELAIDTMCRAAASLPLNFLGDMISTWAVIIWNVQINKWRNG